jgi:Dolichyl-phosphate-mannose-protein mannosyltransferase
MHSPFRSGPPMPQVVSIVELLRARPTAVVWGAVAAQTLLWFVVPSLFYASPPGELPEVLAIGHEWQLGSWLGPPLAIWLAEIAFAAAGGHAFGVYALSQACVAGAFWTMFRLGRSIVGAQHAALAVLLMTGVLALTVPTPEFGPHVLAMPLVALALLLYWRAVGEGRRFYWVALAFDLGLLLLATYWGALVIVLLAAFTLATAQGRAALATIDPWAAGAIALMVPLPHWAWLYRGGAALLLPAAPNPLLGPVIIAAVVASHVGLVALVLLAGARGSASRSSAAEIERPILAPFARAFVLFFAAAPALAGAVAAAALGHVSPAWAGQLVLMSGLAVMVMAENPTRLYRARSLGPAWIAVVTLPAFVIVAAIALLPWLGLSVAPGQEPAGAMGRFFGDTFARRVGKPLELVGGDLHTASLIALAAPSRPSIYAAAAPERTPWTNEADLRRRGAILVWPIQDAVGAPPAALRARFPDLVPEVPQTFDRPVQGFLPSIRIGWAVIRPQPAR